jgi:hypothetical protein
MNWPNIAAWLFSVASLAFAAHPKVAKDLDGANPRKTADITVRFRHVPKGRSLIDRAVKPDNFSVPATSLMKAASKGLPAVSVATDPATWGGNALWANALWGSGTLTGFDPLRGGNAARGADGRRFQ